MVCAYCPPRLSSHITVDMSEMSFSYLFLARDRLFSRLYITEMTDHPGSADGRLSKSFLDLSELLNALEDTEGPGADSDLEAGPTKPLSDAETEYQDSIGDEITSAEVIDLLDPPEEHERFFDLKMVWRGQTFDVCVEATIGACLTFFAGRCIATQTLTETGCSTSGKRSTP